MRSASDISRFVVPATMSRTQHSSADPAYSACAPQLWNSLPGAVRGFKSTDSFNVNLKTFYFPNIFANFFLEKMFFLYVILLFLLIYFVSDFFSTLLSNSVMFSVFELVL